MSSNVISSVGLSARARAWAAASGSRASCDLHAFDVVEVDVRVAERVDEVPRRELALLRDHRHQQRVARDVERHAEREVRGALVELAVEPAASCT